MFFAVSAPKRSTTMSTTAFMTSRRSRLAARMFAAAAMKSGLALAYVSSSKVRPELSRPPPPKSLPRPLMASSSALAAFFAALFNALPAVRGAAGAKARIASAVSAKPASSSLVSASWSPLRAAGTHLSSASKID